MRVFKSISQSISQSKSVKDRMWVFTSSTLWLLTTKQFNDIRKTPGNHFCLVLTETEKNRYPAYYQQLCAAFKKFDAHEKMDDEQKQRFKCGDIPVTHPNAEFKIYNTKEWNDCFAQINNFFNIHCVVKESESALQQSCYVVSPESNRGEFNTEHLDNFRFAISNQYNFGELDTLVIALDLDDTVIKFNEMQAWCLGRNFFNPEALFHVSKIYSDYKDKIKIEFLAITARDSVSEKKAPSYFHAVNLFAEFLRLAGIPLDLRRKQEHVFYTPYIIGNKFKQLESSYIDHKNTAVVLFDNAPRNWLSENPYAHFHFVEVKNEHPSDFNILDKPRISKKPIPPRIPVSHVAPTSTAVIPHASVNTTPPPENKETACCSCCFPFFRKIAKKIHPKSGESQPFATSSRPHYGK